MKQSFVVKFLTTFEHFGHWSDSKKLSDIDDLTGVFGDPNDAIFIDEDNYTECPELESYLLTRKDYEKIFEFCYRVTEHEQSAPTLVVTEKIVGMTIQQAVRFVDVKNDFTTELTIEFLCLLFPNKYTNIPKE